MFRSTDICVKLEYNTFVFLFPKTDAAAAELVTGRIEAFVKSMDVDHDSFILKTSRFSSTVDNVKGETARSLLELVTAKL